MSIRDRAFESHPQQKSVSVVRSLPWVYLTHLVKLVPGFGGRFLHIELCVCVCVCVCVCLCVSVFVRVCVYVIFRFAYLPLILAHILEVNVKVIAHVACKLRTGEKLSRYIHIIISIIN